MWLNIYMGNAMSKYGQGVKQFSTESIAIHIDCEKYSMKIVQLIRLLSFNVIKMTLIPTV